MQVDSSEQTEEKFWVPTPENPGDESEHTPIQQRILRELRDLQRLEELDPKQDEKSRSQFLDIGMNNQFKVCLTPKNDKPVYTQSLPYPSTSKTTLQ